MTDPGKNILVIRADRIGDVVVSTPVFETLKAASPDARITAMVRPYTRDLLIHNPYVDEIIEYDPHGRHKGWRGLQSMVHTLKNRRFDTVITLFSNFRLGLIVFLAGIPVRVAPATKLAQLFYNRRVRQRRSQSTQHEADYNLDLLKAIGISEIKKNVAVWVDDASIEAAGRYLEEQGLLEASREKRLVGIHPGSGGSAGNWSPERYAKLADRLIADAGFSIVLTGGEGEKALLQTVQEQMKERATLFTSNSIMELAATLKRFSVFVSSSTGPMHMAAAVKVPTVSLFCPITACLPVRWGPIGNAQRILLPHAPECSRCIGEKCNYYDCMETITVDSVISAIRELTEVT